MKKTNRRQRRMQFKQKIKQERQRQRRQGLAEDGRRQNASTPVRQERSQSRAQRGVETLESFDGFAALRNGLRRVASERDDYAGIPMPLTDLRLIIEPTYPNADKLAEIGQEHAEAQPTNVKVRNRWWSSRYRADVYVYEEDGKIAVAALPAFHGLSFAINTLGASSAWGIEQESNALQTLGTMLDHRRFKQYLLTGMFLETSKRSGVTYLFRKLRPTVAIAPDKGGDTERTILCALCMHPIAYYEGSWGGAMTPSDDVIAHLALMRSDEPMFWRRCNQHPPNRPQAGL